VVHTNRQGAEGQILRRIISAHRSNRRELIVPTSKQAISLRVDENVLDWFKQTGPRYQTRMNAVLRSYMSRKGKAAAAPERKRQRRKSA
jgi:uncharacterized protein (DUF4415 family)